MTSSSWNIFRVTSPLWGEFTGHRWIPRTKAVTRSFDAFFDLRPNKRLSKQSWGWWFETPSRSLWRHCNVAFTCCVARDIQRFGFVRYSTNKETRRLFLHKTHTLFIRCRQNTGSWTNKLPFRRQQHQISHSILVCFIFSSQLDVIWITHFVHAFSEDIALTISETGLICCMYIHKEAYSPWASGVGRYHLGWIILIVIFG